MNDLLPTDGEPDSKPGSADENPGGELPRFQPPANPQVGLLPVLAALALFAFGLLALVFAHTLLSLAGFVPCGFAAAVAHRQAIGSLPLVMLVMLGVMAILCALTTLVCFASASILVLFPGIPVAIASGQLAGLFAGLLFRRR